MTGPYYLENSLVDDVLKGKADPICSVFLYVGSDDPFGDYGDKLYPCIQKVWDQLPKHDLPTRLYHAKAATAVQPRNKKFISASTLRGIRCFAKNLPPTAQIFLLDSEYIKECIHVPSLLEQGYFDNFCINASLKHRIKDENEYLVQYRREIFKRRVTVKL